MKTMVAIMAAAVVSMVFTIAGCEVSKTRAYTSNGYTQVVVLSPNASPRTIWIKPQPPPRGPFQLSEVPQ